MQTAFAQKLEKSRGENIYLVHGGSDQTGRLAWYFLQVDSAKQGAFLRAIEKGKASLEEFGVILKSGYGKKPSDDIINYMRSEYGYAG